MHRSVHILRPGKARTRRKKRRWPRYSAIRAKKPAEAGFPHHPPGYPRKMTVFWASRPPAVDKPGGKQKLSTVPTRRMSTDICYEHINSSRARVRDQSHRCHLFIGLKTVSSPQILDSGKTKLTKPELFYIVWDEFRCRRTSMITLFPSKEPFL